MPNMLNCRVNMENSKFISCGCFLLDQVNNFLTYKLYECIYPVPLLRIRCDIKSMFKQSIAGLI